MLYLLQKPVKFLTQRRSRSESVARKPHVLCACVKDATVLNVVGVTFSAEQERPLSRGRLGEGGGG